MPRGVYNRTKAGGKKAKTPPAWDLQTTIPSEGLDYLILHAERDELAEIVVDTFEAQTKADLVAELMQRRVNRLLEPPPNIARIGEQLRSFGPPQPDQISHVRETPDHAKTGTDPA